jgi:multidrug efflux pump subunit AcrB
MSADMQEGFKGRSFFTGAKMDFMALIGIIMLMGLVAKDAILLVDSARQRLRAWRLIRL